MPGLIWVLIAFISGSLPLSVWVGRLALGVEITQYGDGNPGAANVWRAGGRGWGALAVLLDFLKGAVPVSLANFVFDLSGATMAIVAIAPVAGHAFSPFLGFRGGKALAVTFGVWSGLTLWLIPAILGVFFGIYMALLKPEGWAVMTGLSSLLAVLLITGHPLWIGIWAGTTLILGWKHRRDLAQRPALRLRKQR